MKRIVFIVSLIVLLADVQARSRRRGGGHRVSCFDMSRRLMCRKAWSERCLSRMNLDVILMLERMDRGKFNQAKGFTLSLVEEVVAARKYTNGTVKVAAFTYGQKDFGVLWPIPKKGISVKGALNYLKRVTVRPQIPFPARAMRFASKFPEPSNNNGTKSKRVIIFIGSGRRGQGDDNLDKATRDIRSSESRLYYFHVGRRAASGKFVRDLKDVATIGRLKRVKRKIWRYLVSAAGLKSNAVG